MAGEELNVKKMKVSELRDALKERGLSTDGLKGDLVNRLEGYLEEQEFAMPGTAEEGSGDTPPTTATTIPSPATPPGIARTTVQELPKSVPAPPSLTVQDGTKKKKQGSKEEEKTVATTTTTEREPEESTMPTEPAPAPVVPEPTPAVAVTNNDVQRNDETTTSTKKAVKEMTHAEKKAARAARFGIPLVAAAKPKDSTSNRRTSTSKNSNQPPNKRQKKGGDSNSNRNRAKKQEEKPLLSVEEIEKRLKRAEKFGTGSSEQTNELKAMLRKHRFAKSGS